MGRRARALRSENSAQGLRANPNPLVGQSIEYLLSNHFGKKLSRTLFVGDQGCGKLRHLEVLLKYFRKIALVDTVLQLTRMQMVGSQRTTIKEYVKSLRKKSPGIETFSAEAFERSSLELDILFSICVFDVVTAQTRTRLVRSALRNVRRGGFYCVVIPRNDQSILKRCIAARRFKDGYAFMRDGYATFYRNFGDASVVSRLLEGVGFRTVVNMSRYRYVWLFACRP